MTTNNRAKRNLGAVILLYSGLTSEWLHAFLTQEGRQLFYYSSIAFGENIFSR